MNINAANQHGFKYKAISLLIIGCFAIPHQTWAADSTGSSDCTGGNAKTIGTVLGVIAGAVIAKQIGGDAKTGSLIIGAALGGLIGNFIGAEIDRRHCELEKIAKLNGIEIKTDVIELKDDTSSTTQTDTGDDSGSNTANNAPNGNSAATPISTGKVDVVRLPGTSQFVSGSATLSEDAKQYFAAMAAQYSAEKAADEAIQRQINDPNQPQPSKSDTEKARKKLVEVSNQRPLVLVGNTDDTGDSKFNQQLSEQRARTVAAYFKTKGIPASRIYFRGAGDSDPVADNHTEEGRAANRRVDIIELESIEKLDNFIALKKENINYLRPKNPTLADSTSVNNQTAASDNNADASEQPSGMDQSSASASATKTHKKSNKAKSGNFASTQSILTGKTTVSDNNAPENQAGTDQKPTADMQASTKNGKEKSDKVTTSNAKTEDGHTSSELDFGGEPAKASTDNEIKSALGKAIQPAKGVMTSIASLGNFFVKQAQADDSKVYDLPCTADAPRYSGKYVSLQTGKAVGAGKEHSTADYAPGLYQTSWVGVVNGNYLGVAPVAVLRGSFQSASAPNLYVYANTTSPGANAKPTLKLPMQVNVYPGENGILYRMYSTGNTKVVCTDLVLPNTKPFAAKAGKLYYKQANGIYQATFEPAILSINN